MRLWFLSCTSTIHCPVHTPRYPRPREQQDEGITRTRVYHRGGSSIALKTTPTRSKNPMIFKSTQVYLEELYICYFRRIKYSCIPRAVVQSFCSRLLSSPLPSIRETEFIGARFNAVILFLFFLLSISNARQSQDRIIIPDSKYPRFEGRKTVGFGAC